MRILPTRRSSLIWGFLAYSAALLLACAGPDETSMHNNKHEEPVRHNTSTETNPRDSKSMIYGTVLNDRSNSFGARSYYDVNIRRSDTSRTDKTYPYGEKYNFVGSNDAVRKKDREINNQTKVRIDTSYRTVHDELLGRLVLDIGAIEPVDRGSHTFYARFVEGLPSYDNDRKIGAYLVKIDVGEDGEPWRGEILFIGPSDKIKEKVRNIKKGTRVEIDNSRNANSEQLPWALDISAITIAE